MKTSLKTKVTVLIAAIIIVISSLGTVFFITSSSRNMERRLITRGLTLSDALSKAAEEGLVSEDLDLIKKAAYIVQRKDVELVQVYSTIWEAIDAYPFKRLKDLPDASAIEHFRNSDRPLYKKNNSRYDFYSPILYKPSPDSSQIHLGFVRLIVSSADMEIEMRGLVIINILVALIITGIVIVALNMLINRYVLKPVMRLHESVSKYRSGELPEAVPVTAHNADEISELSTEFNKMSRAIKDRTDKLVESEKRIKNLFERVEHVIFSLDTAGNIIEANTKFLEMFGAVKSLCILLMSEQKGVDCLLKALSRRVVHVEEKVMDKYGNEITVMLSVYPELDAGGNVTGYDGYLIDITEKKNLEERLLRSQKLEAVGTLAGGIAHDFNNLLAAILGYSEIMQDMTKEGDQFYKPVNIIHDAAQRGAELTQKILAVTRKEKMETKAVDINEIIKNSLELLQRSIPKSIEIVTNLNQHLPHIKGDPTQIHQLIINLAVNSRDAMPEGGRLTLETNMVGVENGAADDVSTEGSGFVKLSVSDTGIGIKKETQGKIFDPFFTTKETGKGTGLGLYIVHSIVNNHGGYINVYSEPGKGTRFNVYLPITRSLYTEEARTNEDLKGSETILVIDDETDVGEMCRDMLTPLGYTVLTAESGSDGIATFRDMKDKISVVVLDMIMPKMGGTEVFQALRTIRQDVRVLLCSGYSQNGFAGINSLLKSGAKAFVQKPFTRKSMASAIKKALAE